MAKQTKRAKAIAALVDVTKVYAVDNALELVNFRCGHDLDCTIVHRGGFPIVFGADPIKGTEAGKCITHDKLHRMMLVETE